MYDINGANEYMCVLVSLCLFDQMGQVSMVAA